MSDDLENKMRSELKNSSEQLKSEVAEILEERQKKTDAKMDAIFQKLQYLSMSMASESVKRSASPVRGEKTFDQAEANRKLVMRRDEQIGQITEQLQVVSEQLEKVQKKSEMDDMARSLSAAMDLPSVMDVQMMGFFQKFKDMQQEQKAQATDVALTLEQVKQRLDEAVKVDFTPVMREVSRCQSMMGEDFQHLVAEIARIQQGLHLDYAQLSKSNMEPVPSPEMSPHETVDSNKVEEKITATPQVEQSKSESKRGTAYSRLKRVREFWSQTENDTTDTWIQTDPDMQKKEKRKTGIIPRKNPKGNLRKANNTLADADAMKEKARKALMQPQYDVFDYYHEEGFFQAIAKHPWFDNVTIFLVCMNAIWIAIEIDNNTASFLLDADLFFIIVENAFCGYFFLEVCVRFGAFARKASALRDFWFVFDFVLVGNMVLETWLLPIIMVSFNITSANFGMDLSVLRMLRMVKLLRLSRIARILRSIPELVIIVKAIGFAARSVAVFLLLWLVIIYLFAVVMTQLTGSIANTPGSQKFFPDVPTAMSSLLLDGILADYAPFIHDMENPLLWLLLLCFVLLSSVTIMYMLVGVLVEVVGVIAAAEKEGIIVSHVASKLRQKMIDMGYNPDDPAISKFQMQSILLEPDIAQMLTMSNVDVVVLMDSLEMLYEDLAKQGGSVTFEKMVDLVLNGRGANVATVRDTKELLRIIKAVVKASTTEIEKKLSEEFGHITAGLNLLREEALARDENPDEEGEDEGDADADPDADLDADAEEEDMQGGPKTR
eukprot:CAMPEP_0197623978 /NCGR_PEP_ID=MMETSP1338-20131121/3820_1 /TAXON_ID=43686 ORGANISM="Pelagodinium beii, Strain RCC1491" /NCGR_SAMPLE_ID=MMETSP1338 /ASSEMBLY_ACC=CAM_ASM_000754 /LENGTH=776 /DNA_ID=CAMNT_0043194073 /DNA_START=164 /DNA_END=2494 /DNA_ORIENTATION=-